VTWDGRADEVAWRDLVGYWGWDGTRTRGEDLLGVPWKVWLVIVGFDCWLHQHGESSDVCITSHSRLVPSRYTHYTDSYISTLT
jgi:hypothetical protein